MLQSSRIIEHTDYRHACNESLCMSYFDYDHQMIWQLMDSPWHSLLKQETICLCIFKWKCRLCWIIRSKCCYWEAARVTTEGNYNVNFQPTDGFLGAVSEHFVVAAAAKFSDKPCYPACPWWCLDLAWSAASGPQCSSSWLPSGLQCDLEGRRRERRRGM